MLTDQLPRLAPVPAGTVPPAPRVDEREIGGLRMHGLDWDSARTADALPVVLVHGLVGASGMVTPLAERLAVRQRVLAPDLPGFGRSGRPRRVLDVDALGAALVGWLGELAPDGAVLVGNSFGCQVALAAVEQRPAAAAALVLLGPTIDSRSRSWLGQLARWPLEQSTQSASLHLVLLRDYLRAGARRAVGTLRAALHDRPEDRIGRIDVPVLVARGTRDPLVTEAWVGELAAAARRGRATVLPGVRHAMAHDDPLEAARVTTHFLDTVALEEV